uniref:Uncharacterized protein n=1 Tax=Naja naja TaxID=35670 RepID=A0A8C6X7B1_NAJNA
PRSLPTLLFYSILAIDRGDPIRTIETLLFPTAKLQNVKEANAWHYQAVLNDAKTYKFLGC